MNVSRFTALLPPGSRKKLSEKTLNRWFAIYRHVFTTGQTDRFDTDLQTGCWVVCFWWIHRLSGRQQAMLEELQEVAKRIETLSKAEHELLQEVHPKVEKIEESVNDMAVAVSANDSSGKAARR